MSAESDLYSALSGRSTLTALVGTRIDPDAIPEGNALPAVVYQRSSTSPVTTIGGVTVAEDVLFEITAWAETRTAADAVADEVAAAVTGAGNPPADRQTGYDSECGLFACTIGCQWWRAF